MSESATADAPETLPVGKRIEAWWRRVRYFVDPRKAIDYAAVRRSARPIDGERPIAWCDFSDPEIDTIGGCHAYHLTRDLLAARLQPVFSRRFHFLASVRSKPYKRFLLELPFATSRREPPGTRLTITDDPKTAARSAADRVVTVDYARRVARPGEAVLPFPPHPCQTRLDDPPRVDVAAARPIGVLFAGTLDGKNYDLPVIREHYGLMTRRVMLATLEDRTLPPPFTPRNDADLARLDADGAAVALVTDTAARIDQRRWLVALARSDFWLACPGTQMPLCHSLAEAMSVGCVPILEYPDYVTPGLVDGENCLVFRGREDLVRVVARAVAMPAEERARLRTAVLAYHDRHLRLGAITEGLLGRDDRRVTLLVNEHVAARRSVPSDAPGRSAA